jgi:hypothetical protein
MTEYVTQSDCYAYDDKELPSLRCWCLRLLSFRTLNKKFTGCTGTLTSAMVAKKKYGLCLYKESTKVMAADLQCCGCSGELSSPSDHEKEGFGTFIKASSITKNGAILNVGYAFMDDTNLISNRERWIRIKLRHPEVDARWAS